MDYQVIVLAAGQGKRMKANKNKILLEVNDKPVILHTLDVFLSDKHCQSILLVVQKEEQLLFQSLLASVSYKDNVSLVIGGKERQDSVYNGLRAANKELLVLVHDGARPFVSNETVQSLVRTAYLEGAAIAAVPVKDTIKKIHDNKVETTIDRESLWQVQTPQAFRFDVLWAAHEQARSSQYLGTDESSLVERLPYPVKIVQSDYHNIKLTTPEDMYFAEAIIQQRKQ